MTPPRWTADDVPDQSGRVAVITGANRGIGFEAARVLANRGATVVLACRNVALADVAATELRRGAPSGAVDVVRLDLADLSSIRAAAQAIAERYDRLDLLINNGGVLMTPKATTVDGFELQFATNHLGHFALTGLLLDRLLAAEGSRVVTVTSVGHVIGRIRFDDLQRERRYTRAGAYAQSKLANALFALELQRRLDEADATTQSLVAHPGSSKTDISRHIPTIQRALSPFARWLQQDAASGALAVVRAAADPAAAGGECFGPAGVLQWRGPPTRVRLARSARARDTQRRLWEVSEALTGVHYVL